MSSRSYQGRHYAGRHRPQRRVRPPRALSAGFVLPSTAAAALVVTATGATVAESAQAPSFDLTGQQSQVARSQEAAGEESATDIATRRQDAQMASSAIQGRAEERARAARAAKRKAAAEAKARAEAERQAKKWVRPIDTWNISSGFGWRWGKNHDGLDLAAPTGTPLYSMSKGTVLSAGYKPSFGYKVEIQYWDGSISWYGHMSRIDVVAGQSLVSGQQVGAVGNTGHSFGSHLHLEFQQTTSHDSPLDPVPWLSAKGLY
ncbi:M23 family metallopeptidase [Phycicoccus sp. BSK3Z-2]|uniref:M23 family metallopeptidase n=1 Tax=Phycicoccus avicenniae TaxID=2828860 RepID=A0A941D7M4_9MICO|nr:M23 family metallopeptidase [Phycicoccus avicenniae]MBR7743594.1 M23 family metallopeptidase [Phycicoccus avicenniae]